MNRHIQVRAQADHIESLFRATPLSAIEELVWNALDADANEIKIDLLTNPLGAVESVRVADDGTGIDIAGVEATFGNLGGSWKRGGSRTPSAGRRLHGRNGRGRFRAFALGQRAEWRTMATVDGERRPFRIVGEVSRPGVFEIEEAQSAPDRGTEVFVSGASAVCDSLSDAGETVQNLAARFALYLKSYPHVRIYFNGLPVTPVIVQKSATNYKLPGSAGPDAKLEVIEWKRRFVGSGRLVFAGPDGFQLHEMPSGIRSGTGASFTAYVISPRMPALNEENALVMDELNPEVRRIVDEARKILKAHFLALGPAAKSAFEAEWEERVASFSKEERKMLLSILKRSLKAK